MSATHLLLDPMHTPAGIHASRSGIVGKRVNRSDTKKDIQARQRAWLLEVCTATKLKPSQIAGGAGVSDSTLTRLAYSEDYTGTLSPETIERIKETYKVPGPEEYANSRRSSLIGLSEAARFDVRKEKGDLAQVVEAIVRGRLDVEPWRLKTMALESAGYLPGDVVFVRMLATGEHPRPQDAVCAQVYDRQHGAAETIWRVYDPPYLVGAGHDRTAYKPMLVDNDRVTIVGVIAESFRPHALSATR
jgi:hypothetical protein